MILAKIKEIYDSRNHLLQRIKYTVFYQEDVSKMLKYLLKIIIEQIFC